MRVDLRGPNNQAAAVWFEQGGESVAAVPGALMASSPSVSMETQATTLMGILARTFGGSSGLMVTHAGDPNSFVLLAPPTGGCIAVIDVTDQIHVVQSAVLFYDTNLDTNFSRIGWLPAAIGANLVQITFTAPGKVGLMAPAHIDQVALENESLYVDVAHLVAWDRSLSVQTQLSQASSFFSRAVSRDFVGVTFTGTGRVWLRTARPVRAPRRPMGTP